MRPSTMFLTPFTRATAVAAPRAIATTLVLVAVLALGVPASAPAAQSDEYSAVWEQIKKLSGTWERYREGGDGNKSVVSYHVTGGDVVVWEEFLGDTPDGVRNMATAYYLDGDGLVATHYCGAGNQPRMRAASWDPEAKVLRFDFWDITNLSAPDAYYTTNIELYFESDDEIELRFRGTTAGETGDWQINHLSRLTTRAHEREGGS